MNDKRNPVRFDDALPRFVEAVRDVLGPQALENNAFLRDATGRLTLILRQLIDRDLRQRLGEAAAAHVGAYCNGPQMATAIPDELFDPSLADPSGDVLDWVDLDDQRFFVRLIERRLIGEDWARPAAGRIDAAPPIVTFYSCKGGVGRSTALAVTAAALAQRQNKVLVIDFDIEAPGLGGMLLKPEDVPEFGVLDYVVENGISGVDDAFLRDCVAPSPLTGGAGLVAVVPAVGRRGRDSPQNVLAKLGRAYLDDPDGQGGGIPFRDQARGLIAGLSALDRYDVVLVDARSGLSEASAAVIAGLGGDVLLFGVDTPQTFESYDYLLAHLSRYSFVREPDADLRGRLRMVHAKADRGAAAAAEFREKAYDLFAAYVYEEMDDDINSLDVLNFDIEDETAPHFPWIIPYNHQFAEFDPHRRPDQLQENFFNISFGPFVDRVSALVMPDEASHGDR